MLFAILIPTFLISVGLTLVIECVASHYGIVPKASYRRKSSEQVPLLGGLAFFLATIPGVFYLAPSWAVPLYAAFLPMLVIGVMDDIREIKGPFKCAAQFLSAFLWVYLSAPEDGFFLRWIDSPYLSVFVAVTFMVGLTNAFNLIDGLDGQAATIAAVCASGLALIAPESPAHWVFVAAFGGFLVRNFNPAKIYMGEVGSSFLGFSLGALATLSPAAEPHWTHFLAILFLFSVPFSDTVGAYYRRFRSHVSVFTGDREHIHHRLIKLQFTPRQALLVTATMVFCGTLTAVLAFRSEENTRYVLFAQAGSILTLMFCGAFWLEKRMSQRLLGLSSQLIVRHLSVFAGRVRPGLPKRAIAVDLLPYFRELQAQGILQLQEFLHDLTQTIHAINPEAEVRALGSYSLLIVAHDTTEWSDQEIAAASRKLYDLFHTHRLVKNTKPVPEGVTFCNGERLQKLLPLSQVLETSTSDRSPKPSKEAS